jgi:hypothetical protein
MQGMARSRLRWGELGPSNLGEPALQREFDLFFSSATPPRKLIDDPNPSDGSVRVCQGHFEIETLLLGRNACSDPVPWFAFSHSCRVFIERLRGLAPRFQVPGNLHIPKPVG